MATFYEMRYYRLNQKQCIAKLPSKPLSILVIKTHSCTVIAKGNYLEFSNGSKFAWRHGNTSLAHHYSISDGMFVTCFRNFRERYLSCVFFEQLRLHVSLLFIWRLVARRHGTFIPTFKSKYRTLCRPRPPPRQQHQVRSIKLAAESQNFA